MGKINKLTDKIFNLNIFIITLFFIITVANSAMPFYTKSISSMNKALNTFSTILNKVEEKEIISNGKLIVTEKSIKSEGDYSIAFNMLETEMNTSNYLLFTEDKLMIRINNQSNEIKYPDAGTTNITETFAVIVAAMETLPGLSLVSSLMLAALIVFLLNVILISSVYFFFNKAIELLSIMRITVASALIPAFLIAILSIVMTMNSFYTILILSIGMTLITLLLLSNIYKELKIKELTPLRKVK